MKCKNVECENETTGKRVYCSLSCRNVFVNKYLRDYSKVSETLKGYGKLKENEYLKDPKRCKGCAKIIPYIKKNNEYCDIVCTGIFLNHSHPHTDETKLKIGKSIKKYIEENGLFGALKNPGPNRQKNLLPKICYNCKKEFINKNQKFCDRKCKDCFDGKNTDKYQSYRTSANFKFNLADYSDEFDFSLVEKYGWYSPSNKKNNLGGISRDHMLSVREGFEMGIDSKIISHPANCRLMIHGENISKNKKSVIKVEELLDRIKKFEEKYEI